MSLAGGPPSFECRPLENSPSDAMEQPLETASAHTHANPTLIVQAHVI
jgi:hypothetical protein